MRRVRAHTARVDFAAEFWEERGLGRSPSTREKFLALAIDEIANVGPYSFNATVLCDLLGTTYPMVNHYFGNRDGLVAEAVATAYRQYVMSMRDAVESQSTPRARLEAWIRRQITWTAENAGIAVVLNFPHASLEAASLLAAGYQPEMTELFELNMALLMQLVLDLQRDAVTPITFGPGTIPRARFMANQSLMLKAASIGLTVLGTSVWAAGEHAAGSAVRETQEQFDAVVDHQIEWLIASAAALD